MKNIISSIIVLLSIINSTSLYSQFDGSRAGKKNNSLGDILTPNKEFKKPESYDLNNNSGFKNANKELEKKRHEKEALQKFNNKGILTKANIRKQQFNKNLENSKFNFPAIDLDLGSFITKSKNINISCYDFGVFDGDVISILINNVAIIKNYTLSSKHKTFKIPISLGFNKIEIIAIDEGKLRPNTGGFTVYDDFNDEVISNKWILAKGAKVIAIVIREEEKDKKNK